MMTLISTSPRVVRGLAAHGAHHAQQVVPREAEVARQHGTVVHDHVELVGALGEAVVAARARSAVELVPSGSR